MPADKDDLFREVAPNTGWQLASGGIDASVTTIPLVSAANLPTGTAVLLTIDRVDSSKKETPDLMERIIGVVDGSNIVDCIRGVEGVAQPHSGGSVVEIVISAKIWNDMVAGNLVEHGQDGKHGAAAAASIVGQFRESAPKFPVLAPQGFLINGKIVPSVVSNNLTVAIKTLAGEDPSESDPVYCRIGDTVHPITAALSVVKNAGTNWMNAGSSELATKEIDYFVYLGYNATDGVVIGFSRIPYANQYSDFSATTTNEKYCAISTITTAASTDHYEVIGRFAATLSAGAGYTWSVPTFTPTNLIQRPIYETRSLSWSPIHTGFSVNPTFSAFYRVKGTTLELSYNVTIAGTSNAAGYTITMPLTCAGVILASLVPVGDNSILVDGMQASIPGSNVITFYKGTTFTPASFTNSGLKYGYVNNKMLEII